MNIEGSCYCGAVTYTANTTTPYPFMQCYCSFCRKTGGSGGYGINIMAKADTLTINGEDNLAYHHGWEHDPETDELVENENRRYFCKHCGSPLWSADPRWAEWIYPFASSIDTELPKPSEILHIMLDFAAPWVSVPEGPGHRRFNRYPDETIMDWHTRQGMRE